MATVKSARSWVRRSTAALVSVGWALSGGALAQAAPAPTGHWCPGDPWNPGWSTVSDWDWNHCHDWQRAGGPSAPAGFGPWGPPPPWAPPPPAPPPWAPGANLMWNQTAHGWGFWNNGIWTPL
jgi:hypothetical protein